MTHADSGRLVRRRRGRRRAGRTAGPSWPWRARSSRTACRGRTTCGSAARSRPRSARRGGAGHDRRARRAPVIVGLDDAELERLALGRRGAQAVGVRDLPVAAASGWTAPPPWRAPRRSPPGPGSASSPPAGSAGCTGDAAQTFDESADLAALARTPIAGGLRRREVDPRRAGHPGAAGDAVGHRRSATGTTRVPRLLRQPTPARPLDWRVDSPEQAAAVLARAARPGRGAGRAWPTRCRRTSSSTRRCTTGCSPTGWPRPARDGVTGKAVTPFLLAHFHRATDGQSLAVNVRIILRNAELAAQIAVRAR